jgi:hypothetical protein
MRLVAVLAVVTILTAVACSSSDSAGPASASSPSASSPEPAASEPPPPQSAGAPSPWGVSLSPRSFEGEDFVGFFDEAAEVGDIVGWYGDWAELEGQGGAQVVASLADERGYEPLYIANHYSQETGLLRPLDAAQRQAYIDVAAAFAGREKPRYLGLGIEVNVLYEKWQADFEAFVSLFDDAAAAIKAASPETLVFTVFQLERMKGLQGGLFGGQNDPALAQWDLIDRFPAADFIAFTTYPGLIYKTPAEIPDDYYDELASRVSKPVAFTEIGWSADLDVQGWESDEAEQAEFVARFLDLTSDLDPELLIWAFLYDPQALDLPLPFQTMGLRRPDGTARPAWDVLTLRP